MSISVNAQFDKFVQFATKQMQDGNEDAIARGVSGRTVRAATADWVGGLGALLRTDQNMQANNNTRKVFKDSIAAMFGGEKQIPDSIKKAMRFDKDFYQGRPLTARRIMAVKEAVDSYVSKAAASNKAVVDFFTKRDGEYENLPEALRDKLDKLVGDLRTRFGEELVSAGANIADIMEQSQIRRSLEALCRAADEMGRDIDFSCVADLFAVNAEDYLAKFVLGSPAFDEIGQKNLVAGYEPQSIGAFFGERNPAVIAEMRKCQSPETVAKILGENKGRIDEFTAVFKEVNLAAKGVEAAAMSDLTRRSGLDSRLVAAHVPTAGLFGKTLNLVASIATGKAKGLKDPGYSIEDEFKKLAKNFVDERIDICGKIDSLAVPESLREHWKADMLGASVLPKFSPEQFFDVLNAVDFGRIRSALGHDGTVEEVVDKLDGIVNDIVNGLEGKVPDAFAEAGMDFLTPMFNMITVFAESKDDKLAAAVAAARQEGVVEKADKYCDKNSITGVLALLRSLNASAAESSKVPVTDKGRFANVVEKFVRSALDDCKITNEMVRDDLTYAMLRRGESALAAANGLKDLSKFLSSVGKQTADLAKARETMPEKVGLAADRMNVKLTAEQLDAAATLLFRYGNDMPDGKNSSLFANFIVRLPLTAKSSDGDEELAKDMASSISGWKDVKAGDQSMKKFTDLCMNEYNMYIESRVNRADPPAESKAKNIDRTFYDDLPRNNYKIGNSEYPKSAYTGKSTDERGKIADDMIEKFMELLPNPGHQRGISAILHQTLGAIAQKASMGYPFEKTQKVPHDPRIVNRNEASGLYVPGVFLQNAKNVSYELQVDNSSKSAVIMAKFDRLTMNISDAREMDTMGTPFGQMSMTMEIKLDMTNDTPKIASFNLDQTLHSDIQ